MPKNNNLPHINKPVELKYGQTPKTAFKNHLEMINVKLMNAPTLDDLLSYIPEFSLATWEDKPRDDYKELERRGALAMLFDGKLLPTAMETIGLTFRLEYLDLVDVTHFLRHRSMSFSAHCTADRDMRHDDVMVKPAIEANPVFFKKYREITEAAKKLYADMVDSDQVSILDARTILPRNLESHYYLRGNLKDIVGLIKQRLDRQIQPMSDNIFALKMWIEIVRIFPQIRNLIDVNAPDQWYINTAPTGHSSNIYRPESKNDTFDWNEQWFLYNKKRKDFPGNESFKEIHYKLLSELASL